MGSSMNAEDEYEVSVNKYSPLTPTPRAPSTVPSTTLPPLIYHVTLPLGTATPTTLQTLLTRHTDLNEAVITGLTALGCIYVHHSPTARTSPRAVRQTLQSLHNLLPSDSKIYIRVHVHPKRYTGLYEPFIIRTIDDFVIVHKPPGMPVCASIDNCKECVTSVVNARCTTRLDVGTSGLLLMANSSEDVARGNCIVKRAKKFYIVFCEYRGGGDGRMIKGLWHDWYIRDAKLGRGSRGPMLRRWEGCADGCVDARLEVLDTWKGVGTAVVAVVQLFTGRTHQIRLQMVARGWLVVGDGKYSETVGRVYDGGLIGGDALTLGLHCWKIKAEEVGVLTADLAMRSDLVALIEEKERFWEWLSGVGRRIDGL